MAQDQSYYYGFTAEDYAADPFFQSWVLKPSWSSDDFWQSYLNLHPSTKSTIDEAKELVITVNHQASSGLTEDEKQEIRSQIFQKLGLDEPAQHIRTRASTLRWLAAASAIAVVSVSAFFFIRSSEKQVPQYVSISTGKSETREIILPDSSSVILNAGSVLRYIPAFGSMGSREVFLEGNAFFKVRKKQNHQSFIVHSNSIQVTVLGTEFNVNSRTPATSVELVNGQVRVDLQNTKESSFMKPGDKVELHPAARRLVQSSVDVRLFSAWTRKEWNFNQTKLEDVFELIGSYYGVKADFRNEAVRSLRITASIPVTDLNMLSLIISKTVHIKINLLNDRMIIQ